ncbi:hypothetical protein Tco_0227690 [Tanacetum coccineum]
MKSFNPNMEEMETVVTIMGMEIEMGEMEVQEEMHQLLTYKDFLNCQPHNFSGTEGVVGLARWFEKIESVFRISNCPSNSQVKFATCTLLDGALTWWNSHVQTIGIDESYEMSWKDLM